MTSAASHPRRLEPLTVTVDARWGMPCVAYNVQIPLPKRAAASLEVLQRAIDAQLSGVVRLVPPDALHISIYGVVPVALEATPSRKESTWRMLRAAVSELLSKHCPPVPPFSLAFDHLEVGPAAVFIRASAHPAFFSTLREELRVVAGAAGLPALPYDIVHVTLARYGRSTKLEASCLDLLTKMEVGICVDVDRVRVVREQVYPSLQTETLEEHLLGSGT